MCCFYNLKEVLENVAPLSLKFEKDQLYAFEILADVEKCQNNLETLKEPQNFNSEDDLSLSAVDELTKSSAGISLVHGPGPNSDSQPPKAIQFSLLRYVLTIILNN